MKKLLAALVVALLSAGVAAQSDRDETFDRILDTYVRDGLVYYRALRQERGPLDRYIASLDVPADRVRGWSPAAQQAFWINAYNALVLRTVINAYPISGRSKDYPDNSIRQIPGAFDRIRHPVGGRLVSLDEIEADVLGAFGDARVLFALGRGAMGSGRLRSEIFRADRLETQLAEAVKECTQRSACVRIDRDGGVLQVTPLVGWREDWFVRTFAPAAGDRWAGRSPVERAVAAMVYPHVFQSEQAMLADNGFRMRYGDFDWRLNDLTGREP